jgi:hypothetical protein
LCHHVLADGRQPEDVGENKVVDADDRQVVGNLEAESGGRRAHTDGHLVGGGEDRGRAIQ